MYSKVFLGGVWMELFIKWKELKTQNESILLSVTPIYLDTYVHTFTRNSRNFRARRNFRAHPSLLTHFTNGKTTMCSLNALSLKHNHTFKSKWFRNDSLNKKHKTLQNPETNLLTILYIPGFVSGFIHNVLTYQVPVQTYRKPRSVSLRRTSRKSEWIQVSNTIS